MPSIGAGPIGEVTSACILLGCLFADIDRLALKGSDHLDFILDHRLIKPQSPEHIEDLYQQVAPHSPDFHFVTASQIHDGTAPPDQLILPADSHSLVAETLGVPELSGEIERAVWQVERQLAAERETQLSKDGSAKDSKPKT